MSISAIVHGKVQGVFFRSSVVQVARRLNLSGYTRNLPDGRSVEIHAEGERKQLEDLLQFLEVGPPGSLVEYVNVQWIEYRWNYKGFIIKY